MVRSMQPGLALTEGKGSMKVDATVDARTRKDG